MITLYHCRDARSFRPLWALEELGLPYALKLLPFPPRFLAREFLDENPLGTIPLLVDGNYVRVRVEASKIKELAAARAELVALGARQLLDMGYALPPRVIELAGLQEYA